MVLSNINPSEAAQVRNKTFCMHGTTLSTLEKQILKEKHETIFLATIFSRNIENYALILKSEKESLHSSDVQMVKNSKEALRKLISEIKLYDPKIRIAIDNEGGTVYRFPWNKFQYKKASEFGDLYKTNPMQALSECAAQYKAIAHELKHDFDIDINFAPSLDLQYKFDGKNNFIYDRAFSEDPEVTYELGRVAIDAMLDEGVTPVIKHIPGHGFTEIDTHNDTPEIDASLEYLQANDFLPFKKLSAQYNDKIFGMTAHIKYPQIDRDNIATFSKTVVGLVRNKDCGIGFNGILMTDTIEMDGCRKAIMEKYPRTVPNRILSKVVQEVGSIDPNIIVLFCGWSLGNNKKVFDEMLRDYFEYEHK